MDSLDLFWAMSRTFHCSPIFPVNSKAADSSTDPRETSCKEALHPNAKCWNYNATLPFAFMTWKWGISAFVADICCNPGGTCSTVLRRWAIENVRRGMGSFEREFSAPRQITVESVISITPLSAPLWIDYGHFVLWSGKTLMYCTFKSNKIWIWTLEWFIWKQ